MGAAVAAVMTVVTKSVMAHPKYADLYLLQILYSSWSKCSIPGYEQYP